MTDMKRTWKGINELLYRRKNNSKTITAVKHLINDSAIAREPSKISNIINERFASVGGRLAGKLAHPRRQFLEYESKCNSPSSSFFFQPVTPQVKLEISSISKNKSYGLHSSPTKLLKLSKDIIAPIISEILNTSVKLGIYPSKL